MLFVVDVPATDVELASDRLWGLGVRGIEERIPSRGRVELWTSVGDDPGAFERAAARLDPAWRWRTEPEPATAETWREHARPVEAGDTLVIVPGWSGASNGRHEIGGRTAIAIDPGAAFGLGDHPTTRLSLAAVERELGERPGARTLDVGCGSGVLAIAAAVLGAPAVRAIDVSDAAIEATMANATENSVPDRIEVDASPLAAVEGRFELVVANILAPVLVSLADDLLRATAPDGRLVVSGILAGAHDHVLDALQPLVPVRTDELEGWAAVTLAPAEGRRQPGAERSSSSTAPP